MTKPSRPKQIEMLFSIAGKKHRSSHGETDETDDKAALTYEKVMKTLRSKGLTKLLRATAQTRSPNR